MWWIPLAAACALGSIILMFYYWHHGRQLSGARIYRARFVQLVGQLDVIATSVNQLASFVGEVKEDKLIEYYESTLRILETLLTATRKIPAYGTDPALLGSAFFLAKDCHSRVSRTQKSFRDALAGKKLKLNELYGHPKKTITTGCYFCSRPVITDRFSEVKVRIDKEVKHVMSCNVCRQQLQQSKKVKVLFFMKEGEPVHWSKVSEYKPSSDYWNINSEDAVRKTAKLELIYSRIEAKSPINTED